MGREISPVLGFFVISFSPWLIGWVLVEKKVVLILWECKIINKDGRLCELQGQPKA